MNWYKNALKELKDPKDFLVDWPKENRKDIKDYIPPERWIPVESSFITHISYHEGLKILEIKTKDGKVYGFNNVPLKVFKKFMKAKSKGEFFNRVIKQNYSSKN